MVNEPIAFFHEQEPPRFLRAQALPYPDLRRVWVRAELTPFAVRPDLQIDIHGPDGAVVASMVMVDVQHTYISLTMHLREPRPGDAYGLQLCLLREEQLLDRRQVAFQLEFVERDEAKAQAEALTWRDRGVDLAVPEEQ